MVVVKNTLLEKAFEAAENDFSAFGDVLKGTTAVLFCDVANAPAKLIKEAGKETGIPALKAAYAEEGVYVGAEHLETLCAIKSKAEVLADVVALLQSPAKNVISALSGAGQTITAYSKRSANSRVSLACRSARQTTYQPSRATPPKHSINK